LDDRAKPKKLKGGEAMGSKGRRNVKKPSKEKLAKKQAQAAKKK